jgi:hypothetical protein
LMHDLVVNPSITGPIFSVLVTFFSELVPDRNTSDTNQPKNLLSPDRIRVQRRWLGLAPSSRA